MHQCHPNQGACKACKDKVACQSPPQPVEGGAVLLGRCMHVCRLALLTLEVSCCCQQLGLALQRQRTQLTDTPITTWGQGQQGMSMGEVVDIWADPHMQPPSAAEDTRQ
jgi:hypothetical protein